jgi:hypothetical protein
VRFADAAHGARDVDGTGDSAHVHVGSDGRRSRRAWPTSQRRRHDRFPAKGGSRRRAPERRAVALERGAAEAPWRISTHDGAVRLDAGAIEVACLDLRGSPATRALFAFRLRRGASRSAHTDLVPGREVWLRGGALVLEGPIDSVAQDGSQRTGAAATASASRTPPRRFPRRKRAARHGRRQAGAQLPETFRRDAPAPRKISPSQPPKAQEFREPAFAIEGSGRAGTTVFVPGARLRDVAAQRRRARAARPRSP